MEDSESLQKAKPEELLVASKFTLMEKLIDRLKSNRYLPEKTDQPSSLNGIPIPSGVNVFDACAELAETDDDLRVFARSEGVPTLCSQFLRSPEADGSIDLIGACLRLLAIIIRDDRISKTLLLNSGVLESEKIRFFSSHSLMSSNESSEHHLKHLNGAMLLYLECSRDSYICTALKCHEDSFVVALSIVVESIGSFSQNISDPNRVVEIVSFYRAVSMFNKNITFSKDNKIITQK